MKKLALAIACTLLLTGCSKQSTDVVYTSSDSVSVPISIDHWIEIPILDGDYVTSTDGYVQWQLNSGGTIEKYTGNVTDIYESPAEISLYYKSAGTTIVISNNREWVDYLRDNSDFGWYAGQAELKKDGHIGTWQSVSELPYVETTQGILMPPGIEYNTSLVPAYKNGNSYFTPGVRYWNEDEVKTFSLSYLAMYGGGEVSWMFQDGNFMAHNDVVGVGYKKITVNKYVVYMSSYDMFDYVLLNVQKVLISE